MKRTIKLPPHFEGDLHIHLGDKILKFALSSADTRDATLATIPTGGKICHQQCMKTDKQGNCIHWVTVCHVNED